VPQEEWAILANYCKWSGIVTDIEERLRILLDYWIEHNREHEKEFRDWADKAASLSSEIAQQLQEAATKMAEASNCLGRAREALTKGMERR
jgi:hypothetical protein